MAKLAFIPKRHGWHFTNSFVTRVLPGVINVQTTGLCGGMVMSALDYWRAGLPIPTHQGQDFGPSDIVGEGEVPHEASTLRRYIFDRQMNSLLTRLMASRWLYDANQTPVHAHEWATGSEFAIVQHEIERGRPAMLGLWGMVGEAGHQVLAYGWDRNPPRLYVYDPNVPDQEVLLVPVSPDHGLSMRTGGLSGTEYKRYRGYFFMDVYNWGESPPYQPPYRDLGIFRGVDVEFDNPAAPIRGRVRASATVTNIGEFPARFKGLFVYSRGPNGDNLDAKLGGMEGGVTRLVQGKSHTLKREAAQFGDAPGTYSVGVSFLTNQDDWINIPPSHLGARSVVSFSLYQPKALAVDEMRNVPESTRSDMRTNIVLDPGNDYHLEGSGTIWAGVLGTGLNGPEGWEDWVESKPNSPMHNTPDAQPFALIGRFGSGPYFKIGREVSRRTYNGAGRAELLLRINDDTPANGSGQFQCHVEVWR